MHSLSILNGRYCPNRACTIVVFRAVVTNICPVCETVGVIIERLAMGLREKKS